MPPGDTLILNSPDELPDSIRQIVDSLIGLQSFQGSIEQKGPRYPFPEWIMFLFLLFVIGASAYFYVIRPAGVKKRRIRKLLTGDSSDKIITEIRYDQWLSRYNPYYNSLTPDLKKRFINRTIQFKESKEFRFHFMEPEEQVMILISGAAIQVTFGLKNYLMDYYSLINVVRKEYKIPHDEDLYYGHVSRQSISISWNHFLQGFEDYTDSSNVGLHEMAHAVSFDVFLGQTDHHDHAFKERLSIFQKKGIPVFRAMRQSTIHLLDDYGSTNFDEFWAVCVATFFENTEEFSRTMPDLYLSVAELLNQDPLKPDKVINKELAGLAN